MEKKEWCAMDVSAILQRSENATFEVVADEAILIHLETGSYFSLNRIGTEFWEMLDGQQSLANHAAALARKYQVASERVEADLLELSERLAEAALVIIPKEQTTEET